MLARERAREKATHDGSDVVHGNVVTTPDLMGGITLLGAVLVHNDELGGRCGCSKRNQPRRHFDCGASSTVSHARRFLRGVTFRRLRILRSDHFDEDHNQPDPATQAPGHVTKKRLRETSDCPKTGNSQTRIFPLQFVVRPSETAKSPPWHAGSAHEQSRAEVPSKYVPSPRGVSHTKARSEKPSEVPSCRAAVRYDSR